MAVKKQPEGLHTVIPYLIIKDAAGVIDFAKKIFDAKEIERMSTPDGTIAHAEITIGDSMIMFGEAGEKWPAMPTTLYVYVDDTDATYKKALEEGGESIMQPADQFYGDRNAGVKDKSGNLWWIATHVEDVSPEDIKKRSEEMMKKR